MREIYRNTLRLYPSQHRAIFALDMMATFDQAAADYRKRGVAPAIWFAAKEEVSLLQGIVTEWFAKLVSGDQYLAAECLSPHTSNTSLGVVELQLRIQQLIRGMEYAIAHHDFPKARHYSYEERATRAQLERLLDGPSGQQTA